MIAPLVTALVIAACAAAVFGLLSGFAAHHRLVNRGLGLSLLAFGGLLLVFGGFALLRVFGP